MERRQQSFSREIDQLRDEVNDLQAAPEDAFTEDEVTVVNVEDSMPSATPMAQRETFEPREETSFEPEIRERAPSALKTNWEKFIGENLINKIGIAIIVLGVGIGAKYAIDNDLISPLTRIILGYLAGLGLLLFAMRLKAKYEKFSAVLLSGSIAILYFITYAAFSFYGLIPQPLAFAVMVGLTVFTVYAAIQYNTEVIALIGLVGAYAVPFLLSTGEGNVLILFSYMSIINAGILFLAFKRDWNKLFYAAFTFTWLIFTSWAVTKYDETIHFYLGFIFLTVFFLTFYGILLAYKVIKEEVFGVKDIILLLINSFIFFGYGFVFLLSLDSDSKFLGIFTVINAVIHFIVGFTLYKKDLADKNLFYFVVGLVLVFITIAVPVQLDGSWVTLVWAGEAALLFWIGRTKGVPVYEKLSYCLMIIAFFSLIQDWEISNVSGFFYYKELAITPFLNIGFFSSLLVAASFGFITYLSRNKNFSAAFTEGKTLNKVVSYTIPTLFIIILYNTFRLEISNYWMIRYLESSIEVPDQYDKKDYDLLTYRSLWIMYYSMLFVALLVFINVKKLKNSALTAIGLILGALMAFAFLSSGLYFLSELRESYLNQNLAEYYNRSWFSVGMRYIGIAFLGLLITTIFLQIRESPLKTKLKMPFQIFLALNVLWVLSSELLNIMDILGQSNDYRLSLSILWGVFSLALITIGIAKKVRHLRISAIVLFGVTLLKLFLYDIAALNTISKTIVFVALGILLLIISFLYNKYKHLIFEEDEKE